MFRGASTRPAAEKPVATSAALDEVGRERLVRLLSAATFLIFFQAYMVAPLIPRLSAVFGVFCADDRLDCPGLSHSL